MGTGMGMRLGVAAAMLAGLASAATAQAVVADALPCEDSWEVGSLGITGIECDRCRFITGEGADRAIFYTEPVILGLRSNAPSSRVLRSGDVLLAIGGQPITTSQGWALFNNMPAEGEVTLRIRRDGREREVNVPVMAVCADRSVRGVGTAPRIAGRTVPVPPRPPRADVAEPRGVAVARAPSAGRVRPTEPLSPAAPTADAAPSGVLAPRPPAAPLADLPPRVSLGFGFQCSECSYDGEREVWSFTEPPEVQGVRRGSAAWDAGLRTDDRIVAIDGLDVMTEEGGRHFAEIETGDRVAWLVERGGTRREIHLTVADREREARLGYVGRVQGELPVRFAGTVGGTTVEVRGGRVAVTESEDGELIVIQTGDTVIRIRAAGSGGGSGRN